jgi:hypothetical protein
VKEMTGIDLQIHVLRVCDRQLKKLDVASRLSVLGMLAETHGADKSPPPPGQVVIPGSLEATRSR